MLSLFESMPVSKKVFQKVLHFLYPSLSVHVGSRHASIFLLCCEERSRISGIY